MIAEILTFHHGRRDRLGGFIMMFRSFVAACLAVGVAAAVATPAAAQSGESGYAVLGKWFVTTVWAAPNKFGYCAATTNNGKADFRIGTDGRAWQVGTPYYGKQRKLEAYYGFEVAGEVANLRAEGDGWASMAISGDQLNAFRTLPTFALNIGNSEQTWDLRGAGPAIDKAAECARNRGVPKGAAATAPVPAPAPAPVAPAAGAVGQARPFGQGFDGWTFTATTERPGVVNCRAIRKVGGREDIMAMRTDWKPYLSIDAEGRRGKWKDMYILIPGKRHLEWRVPAEANGARFWFLMPDFGVVGEIAANGVYEFAVPDSEDTAKVPLGRRAAEAWERVNQCVAANGG